jgi:BirA family biotin operon repressor/biotin-[acetyl-CoA-carboxylase] ligase
MAAGQGLAVTLVVSRGEMGSPRHVTRLPLLVAVELRRLIESLATAGTRPTVKWPNDVLVEGRKVSGILLETASVGEAGVLPWLAIGIGINLVFAPKVANYPTTFVNEHAQAPDALGALSVLARAWDIRLRTWQTRGFSQTRSDWLQVAAGVGGRVEARLAGETITGIFRTLASDGSLELDLPDEQSRTISAGEVFFPDAMR